MVDGDPRKNDPEYHAVSALIESTLATELARGNDTESIHDKILGVIGKYTSERESEHWAIVDEFVGKKTAKAERKMLFIGGLPGSGKTTFLKHGKERERVGVDLDDYVVVNPDEVKEVMLRRGLVPEYEGLGPDESSTMFHEESSHISKLVAAVASERGLNIVFDTSLGKRKQWDRAMAMTKDKGYSSALVFIDVPITLSMQRARIRHETPGRYIPYDLIAASDPTPEQVEAGYWSTNRANFEEVKGLADLWYLVDNTVEGGRITESNDGR